jgi:hypothetical protein
MRMSLAEFAKSFKSIWGLGVALALAGPLGLSIPELYPPWPDNSRLIGVIFCAVAALLSFAWGSQLTRRSTAKQKAPAIIATISLACGLAFILVYFAAYSSYVVVETQMVGSQQRSLRFVVGAETSGSPDGGSTTDYLGMLRDNQYDPERIWTRDSLRRSRFLLFGSFVAAFSMLTFGMGLLATRSTRSRAAAARGDHARPTHASG